MPRLLYYIKKIGIVHIINISIILTLCYIIVHILYNPTPCQQSEIDLQSLLALGPFPDPISQYLAVYQEFVAEVGGGSNKYGMIDESKINYKIRQIILDYPRWLEYYIKFRSNAWEQFQDRRLTDKVLPDYDPFNSQLIEEASKLQQIS